MPSASEINTLLLRAITTLGTKKLWDTGLEEVFMGHTFACGTLMCPGVCTRWGKHTHVCPSHIVVIVYSGQTATVQRGTVRKSTVNSDAKTGGKDDPEGILWDVHHMSRGK
jgi:hypothetical protein